MLFLKKNNPVVLFCSILACLFLRCSAFVQLPRHWDKILQDADLFSKRSFELRAKGDGDDIDARMKEAQNQELEAAKKYAQECDSDWFEKYIKDDDILGQSQMPQSYRSLPDSQSAERRYTRRNFDQFDEQVYTVPEKVDETDILVNQLGYTEDEVFELSPETISILVEKRIYRPQGVIPSDWKKWQYSASPPPLEPGQQRSSWQPNEMTRPAWQEATWAESRMQGYQQGGSYDQPPPPQAQGEEELFDLPTVDEFKEMLAKETEWRLGITGAWAVDLVRAENRMRLAVYDSFVSSVQEKKEGPVDWTTTGAVWDRERSEWVLPDSRRAARGAPAWMDQEDPFPQLDEKRGMRSSEGQFSDARWQLEQKQGLPLNMPSGQPPQAQGAYPPPSQQQYGGGGGFGGGSQQGQWGGNGGEYQQQQWGGRNGGGYQPEQWGGGNGGGYQQEQWGRYDDPRGPPPPPQRGAGRSPPPQRGGPYPPPAQGQGAGLEEYRKRQLIEELDAMVGGAGRPDTGERLPPYMRPRAEEEAAAAAAQGPTAAAPPRPGPRGQAGPPPPPPPPGPLRGAPPSTAGQFPESLARPLPPAQRQYVADEEEEDFV